MVKHQQYSFYDMNYNDRSQRDSMQGRLTLFRESRIGQVVVSVDGYIVVFHYYYYTVSVVASLLLLQYNIQRKKE